MNGTLFIVNSIVSFFRAETLLLSRWAKDMDLVSASFAHDLVEIPKVVEGSFTFWAGYKGHGEVISSGFADGELGSVLCLSTKNICTFH